MAIVGDAACKAARTIHDDMLGFSAQGHAARYTRPRRNAPPHNSNRTCKGSRSLHHQVGAGLDGVGGRVRLR